MDVLLQNFTFIISVCKGRFNKTELDPGRQSLDHTEEQTPNRALKNLDLVLVFHVYNVLPPIMVLSKD